MRIFLFCRLFKVNVDIPYKTVCTTRVQQLKSQSLKDTFVNKNGMLLEIMLTVPLRIKIAV